MKPIDSFIISRPLVFLCGCKFKAEKNDRRAIVNEYIYSLWKDENSLFVCHPMPIIVDNIFSQIEVSDGLSIPLLEEIVSAVAERTYIFLDSMSASYEMGQFTNFKMDSKTHVFLEDDFEKRERCPIGEYIIKSQNDRISRYPADHKNGYLYFENNTIPKEVAKTIDNDLQPLKNNSPRIPLVFISDESERKSHTDIRFSLREKSLSFVVPIKTLFYLLISEIRKVSGIRSENDLNRELFSTVFEGSSKTLLASFVAQRFELNFLSFSPEISLKIDGYRETNDIAYHVFALIILIISRKRKKTDSVLPYSNVLSNDYSFETEMFKDVPDVLSPSLWNLTKDDVSTIKKYSEDPFSFVVRKTITTNDKRRQIITYRNTNNGKKLRYLHCKLLLGLNSILPTSNNSFAYKTGMSTKRCLEQHLSSTCFEKLDIKSFFASIQSATLKRMLQKQLVKYQRTGILSYFYNPKRRGNAFRGSSFRTIFSSMFYHGHLPIGFITSPKISDFYLYEIDCLMCKLKNIIYTRYADDILISSNGDLKTVREAKNTIESELKKLKLELNTKTIERQLLHENDSIKFLGINIVRRTYGNVFTISRKYLIETSIAVEKYYHSCNNNLEVYEAINGKVAYIKSVSESSFAQLVKYGMIHDPRNPIEYPLKKHVQVGLGYKTTIRN